MLRPALDGLRQFFRCYLPQCQVDGRQVLSKQRVEFGVVRGAVLGAEPPAPVAPLRGQERLERFLERGFGGGIRSSLLARFECASVGFARIPQ